MHWWKGGELPLDVWKIADEIEKYLEDNQEDATEDMSVEDLLAQAFKYEKDSDEEKIYQWILNYRFGQDYGSDQSKLSARYVEEDNLFNGTEDIIPGGYQLILDIIAKDLDIRLGCDVIQLDYSGEKISITLKDGRQFEAT